MEKDGHYRDIAYAQLFGDEADAGSVERRDDGASGKNDAREGPREAREDDAGEQRQGQQAEKRLDADDDVGVNRLRHELGVIERADGLDAEQEHVPEIAAPGMGERRGVGQVEQGERDIDEDEERDQAQEKQPPRRRQHAVIEIGPARSVLALDDGDAAPRPRLNDIRRRQDRFLTRSAHVRPRLAAST